MKKTLLITSLLAAALAISCKPSTAKPADEPNRTTDKAQIATKDPALPIGDYNFGQKTEFVLAMRAQLVVLNQDLDALSAQIDKSNEAVQAEAQPKLAVLRKKAAQWSKQVDELPNATLPTWDVMKTEAEKAGAHLKDEIAQARQAVTDKIAP